MAVAIMGFAGMWQDPKFDDMIIRLLTARVQVHITLQPDPTEERHLQVELRCIPAEVEDLRVNKTVMASVSGYWMSRLQGWDEDAHGYMRLKVGQHTSMMVFEETINLEELPAVQVAVLFAYKLQVPNSLTALLQAVRLAARWAMPGYLTACLSSLASRDLHGMLTARDISAMLADDLPAAVHAHPGFQAVKDTCAKALLQLFGRPQQLFNDEDPEPFNQFCDLPFTAVLLWAQQDGLQVDSENSVAVLITHWWQQNMWQVCLSADTRCMQMQQLSSALRVQHLHASFFVDVLHQLPWFSADHESKAYSVVSICKKLGATGIHPKGIPFPAAWLAGPRLSCDQELVFCWQVTDLELHMLHEGAQPAGQALDAGQQFFWKGFWWQACLWLESQRSALYLGVRTLGIGVAGVPPPSCMHLSAALMCVDAQGAVLASSLQSDFIGPGQQCLGDSAILDVPVAAEPRPHSLPPDRLRPDGSLYLQVIMCSLDLPGYPCVYA